MTREELIDELVTRIKDTAPEGELTDESKADLGSIDIDDVIEEMDASDEEDEQEAERADDIQES